MRTEQAAPGHAARKPEWLRVRLPAGAVSSEVGATLRRHGLHTVCDEARCPNKAECWGQATATFMVMGSVCTRGCRFCAVDTGRSGLPLDPREPEELAAAVGELGLRYAVVTSVDRDDLPDRGAAHFAACVRSIRARDPSIGVEVLAPDYQEGEIEALLEAGPEVFAHNLETVERLQGVRDARASWAKSLRSLELASGWAAARAPSMRVKSSILLGLGERPEELEAAMEALRGVGVSILVLGQYLRPSPRQIPVAEYVRPETFAAYAELGRAKGFSAVVSSPLARTSYHARSVYAGAAAEAAPRGQAAEPAPRGQAATSAPRGRPAAAPATEGLGSAEGHR